MILDTGLIKRTALAGAVLALVGIVLFVLIWFGLGNASMSQFARIVLSICIPPILMAAGMGVYFLLVRPAPKQPDLNEE
jgi:hypothetical protein